MADMEKNSCFKVWLVTGCSSGFGKEFISAITRRGDKVIATARDISTLVEYTDHENIHLLQMDLLMTKEILGDVVRQALSAFGRVDVLVNNAGYVMSGLWEELSEPGILRQFRTNVFGPLDLTSHILPHMRSRGRGTIIFMSSIAAWRSVAVGGPYSTSKLALEGVAESLRQEVERFGINIHIAVLGQFRTKILESGKRHIERPTNSIGDYDELVTAFQLRLARTNGVQPGNPSQAVERILDAVQHTGYFGSNDKIPFRLVLGSDAMGIVRDKCQSVLDEIAEQETLGKSTDFEDARHIEEYK